MTKRATFHFASAHHVLQLTDDEQGKQDPAEAILRQAIDGMVKDDSSIDIFGDFCLYQQLLSQQGCVSVDISKVHIDHSRWFLTGIQTTYTSVFSSGETREIDSRHHEFRRFQYIHHKSRRSTLELGEGEFLTNVAFRNVNHVVDRVIFETNQRTMAFGSPDIGGYKEEFLLPRYRKDSNNPQSDHGTSSNDSCCYRRIVAFAGVISGMVEKVGVYSESMHWRVLKQFILVRRLLETKRASQRGAMTCNVNKSPSEEILIELLSSTNDELFRTVLGYLVPDRQEKVQR